MSSLQKEITVATVGPKNAVKPTWFEAMEPVETRDQEQNKGCKTVIINESRFRFLDPIDIPDKDDGIYSENISKVINRIRKSDIVIMMAEITEDYKIIAERFHNLMLAPRQKAIILINKLDLMDNTRSAYDIEEAISTLTGRIPTVVYSTEKEVRVDKVKETLIKAAKLLN